MTCELSEARHTAPHAACPSPEYWHAPDPDTTETEISELVGALVRALQPELVIETGTAFGYTTVEIGKALNRNGHGRCVSLEVDPERQAEAAERWRQTPWIDRPEAVEFRMESSLEYVPTEMIGFALFDSLYELRAAEFRRFRPWLRAGAIVAFHDWTSGLRGHYLDVKAEVTGLAEEGLLVPCFIPSPRGLAVCEVL